MNVRGTRLMCISTPNINFRSAGIPQALRVLHSILHLRRILDFFSVFPASVLLQSEMTSHGLQLLCTGLLVFSSRFRLGRIQSSWLGANPM